MGVLRYRCGMRILRTLIAFILTLAAPAALAQTWPDLADDAGVQGGGENDAALIVGVTDYYNLPKIDGAAQNAEAWQQWLLRSRKVPSSKVMLLSDKAATRPKIEKALQQLASQVGPTGTLWFVFIGHGAPSRSGDDGMLLGVDTDADADSIDDRGVPQQRVLSLVGQGKQAHSVVVFDACFSGKTGDGSAPLVAGLQATLPNRRATMSTAPKATVLAASDSFAGPLPNAGRPAFSYLLLGALRGWGDQNGDKAVDVDEAYAFSRDYIQALFKGSDRLPSKRGPPVVLAKNVREKQPDMAALVSGKCPSGWTWGGRECRQQAAVECPAGTTWNGSVCVSLCPAGTSWNGRACAATTIECPASTEWNGSACVGKQLASLPAPPAPAGDSARAGETRRDGRSIRTSAQDRVTLQKPWVDTDVSNEVFSAVITSTNRHVHLAEMCFSFSDTKDEQRFTFFFEITASGTTQSFIPKRNTFPDSIDIENCIRDFFVGRLKYPKGLCVDNCPLPVTYTAVYKP